MIFYLEEKNMFIEKLEVKDLHGIYNYVINFNQDLTFIYGKNGCGKTTILNIVSSIVTGKIYNLFSYKFSEIILTYSINKRTCEKITISKNDDTYVIFLSEDNFEENIEEIEFYSREDDEFTFERRFMNMYESPSILKDKFNYIYLPLSRNSQNGANSSERNFVRRRSALYSEKDIINKNYLNDSLHYVEEIVRNGYMRINSSELSINARFRSDIFTSSLKVTNKYSDTALIYAFESKGSQSISSVDKNKNEYIKLLKSIGEWNDDTSKSVEEFFVRYKKAFEESKIEDKVSVEFLLMNLEFTRIKEIASQAQTIEKEKEKNRKPITNFLKIVNKFFEATEDKKTISIDTEGKLNVESGFPERKLSLYNLSSGEKQIIIIFACLIFGLPLDKKGIYIIDEPEASLHLAWQKIFVDSIKEVNKSIQFIFATHSPEIISRYSNRAVKLIKTINFDENKIGE